MYNFDKEIEVGTSGEWIVVNLVPCDNVAIPNDTNDSFWIMLIDKGPHFVESNFQDG